MFPLLDRTYPLAERELLCRYPMIARLAYKVFDRFFDRFFSPAMIEDGWQRRTIEALCQWNLDRVRDPALRRRLLIDA